MAKKMGPKFVALCSVAVGTVYAAGYVVTNKPIQSLAATMPSSQSSAASEGQGSSTGLPGQSSTPQFPPQGGFERHHHHDGDGYGRDGGYGGGDDGGYGGGDDGGYGGGDDGGYGGGYGGSGSGQFGGSGGFGGSSGSTAGSSGAGASGQGTTTAQSKTAPASQKYVDGTYNGSGSNRIGMVSVAVTIKSGKIADVQITQCYTHYSQSYIDPVLPQQVVSTQSPNVNNISGATLSTEDFQTAVLQALRQAQNPNYKG